VGSHDELERFASSWSVSDRRWLRDPGASSKVVEGWENCSRSLVEGVAVEGKGVALGGHELRDALAARYLHGADHNATALETGA
jgi:hypothetical protein